MKKLKYFLIISIFIMSIKGVNAQSAHPKPFPEYKLVLYNAALGAVIGGFGAAINKKKNEKFHHAFLKGLAKGCAGGLLIYGGKRTASLINTQKEPGWAWPAKLIHTTGASMIENAAANRGLIDNWSMEFGFIRFDINIKSIRNNGHNKLLARLQPFSLYYFIDFAVNYNFDVVNTLRTGTPFFTYDGFLTAKVTTYGQNTNSIVNGRARANSILIATKNDYFYYETIAHELIHTYQFRELVSLNQFVNKPINFVKDKSNFVNFMSKLVYIDTNYIFLFASFQRDYSKNIYEIEAHSFAH